jgi:hypothetical protein
LSEKRSRKIYTTEYYQGFEKADKGEIETGETISFGYFAQKGLTGRRTSD